MFYIEGNEERFETYEEAEQWLYDHCSDEYRGKDSFDKLCENIIVEEE